MKFESSNEWLRRRIPNELDYVVSEGVFPDGRAKIAGELGGRPQLTVFGATIQLLRRARNMSVENLAFAARVDSAEIVRIEHESDYVPTPHAIERLSSFFQWPHQALVKASTLKAGSCQSLGAQARRFATDNAKVKELTLEENAALSEFVQFLNVQTTD